MWPLRAVRDVYTPSRRNLTLFVVSCVCVLLTAALIGILMEMMLTVDSAVTRLLCNIIPTVLFGAGLLPQIHESSARVREKISLWSDSSGILNFAFRQRISTSCRQRSTDSGAIAPSCTRCSCWLQADKNDVYFVSMELDEEVAKLHFLALGLVVNVPHADSSRLFRCQRWRPFQRCFPVGHGVLVQASGRQAPWIRTLQTGLRS